MKEGQKLKIHTNEQGVNFYFCPDCECMLFKIYGTEKYMCVKCNVEMEIGLTSNERVTFYVKPKGKKRKKKVSFLARR